MTDKLKQETFRRIDVIKSKLESVWDTQSLEEHFDDIIWIADPLRDELLK